MSLRFGIFWVKEGIFIFLCIIMINTIKLRNDSNRNYNGIKPGQTVNVEDPTFYIANGFHPIDELPAEREDGGLESKTLKELKELCQELSIEVPNNAKKADLIELIEKASAEEKKDEEESDEDLEKELE